MHGFVSIGVVEMPVRVDQDLQRSSAEAVHGLLDLWRDGGEARIHENFSIRAAQDHHVSTGAGKQIDIVAELGCHQRDGGHLRLHLRDAIGGGRHLLQISRPRYRLREKVGGHQSGQHAGTCQCAAGSQHFPAGSLLREEFCCHRRLVFDLWNLDANILAHHRPVPSGDSACFLRVFEMESTLGSRKVRFYWFQARTRGSHRGTFLQ